MSVISEKSPKHCANKQASIFHNLNKKLLFYLTTLFLTILSLTLLLWFILHPKSPIFSVKQATINITAPSSIHLALLSTNPNKKAAIYYDDLLLYASCNGQIIAPQTAVRPFYQEHEETNILKASLAGNQVQHAGKLDLKVTGRLRWKVGNWVSGRHRFSVNCSTVVSSGHAFPTSGQGTVCSTSV